MHCAFHTGSRVEMFEWLKPIVDGFRNFVADDFKQISQGVAPEEFFLDKANLMTLNAPEWTVLTGGLRALNCNHDASDTGIFTYHVGALTNDFFVHLTDTDLVWEKASEDAMRFALKQRSTGITKFTASRNDLVFGSNSQLRAVVDVYAASDGHSRFVKDFIKVWDKVMMLDRYDIKGQSRTAPMAA
jgi:catalase-peroxidase